MIKPADEPYEFPAAALKVGSLLVPPTVAKETIVSFIHKTIFTGHDGFANEVVSITCENGQILRHSPSDKLHVANHVFYVRQAVAAFNLKEYMNLEGQTISYVVMYDDPRTNWVRVEFELYETREVRQAHPTDVFKVWVPRWKSGYTPPALYDFMSELEQA